MININKEKKTTSKTISLEAIKNKGLAYGLLFSMFFLFSCGGSGIGDIVGDGLVGAVGCIGEELKKGDFTISTKSVTKNSGYTETSYGSVTKKDATVTVNKYSIVGGDDGEKIEIDSKTGVITIDTGLLAGTYSFKVKVEGAKKGCELSVTIDGFKLEIQ